MPDCGVIAVRANDKRTFEGICEAEGRTRIGQFRLILDDFCRAHGFDRASGRKVSKRGRSRRNGSATIASAVG